MGMSNTVVGYGYKSATPSHTFGYLLPAVSAMLPSPSTHPRVLDVGCGNGYWCGWLASRGYTPVGIDASETGVDIARREYPAVRFEACEIAENLLEHLGEQPFDAVVSLEVVEHMYFPRTWARACWCCLRPGGVLVCSTPYHGYVKNLLISLGAQWDWHHNPLWDGGHIKFWSRATLGKLLGETGFRNIRFRGAGRAPLVWKSLVASAERPAGPG
jgi:cyclopropane fatty-acyl-phospholipid synthase-like methyltransferase